MCEQFKLTLRVGATIPLLAEVLHKQLADSHGTSLGRQPAYVRSRHASPGAIVFPQAVGKTWCKRSVYTVVYTNVLVIPVRF